MCQKQAYASSAEAKRNLRFLRVRKMRKDRALNVYRCPECAGGVWHVGHGRAA